jgi:hypothetical protein
MKPRARARNTRFDAAAPVRAHATSLGVERDRPATPARWKTLSLYTVELAESLASNLDTPLPTLKVARDPGTLMKRGREAWERELPKERFSVGKSCARRGARRGAEACFPQWSRKFAIATRVPLAGKV